MAVTIDWPSGIISVPRADMPLVQSTPTEIRSLDLNWFRLQLKALEDTPEGMTFLKTHDHNTEVELGGIVYARIIEILAPYTVTFEDGQYAVNLTGANSNVGDRVNVNQVSVRSQNSAGLISNAAIEYSSFNGGVVVDVNSGNSGTIFPTGTLQLPVDNLTDALLIANFRGFDTLFVNSDLDINNGFDLEGFSLIGKSHVDIQVTIEPDSLVDNVTIDNCDIAGTMDGFTTIDNSSVRDINFFNGHIHNSELIGTITLGGNIDAYLNECTMLDVGITPTIDMGGNGQDLSMPNYNGTIEIINMTGSTSYVGIGLTAGNVILDSTSVTSGTVNVSGIGVLVDENGDRILSGTWNGGVLINNELINRDTISEATQLGEAVYINSLIGVTGTTFPI